MAFEPQTFRVDYFVYAGRSCSRNCYDFESECHGGADRAQLYRRKCFERNRRPREYSEFHNRAGYRVHAVQFVYLFAVPDRRDVAVYIWVYYVSRMHDDGEFVLDNCAAGNGRRFGLVCVLSGFLFGAAGGLCGGDCIYHEAVCEYPQLRLSQRHELEMFFPDDVDFRLHYHRYRNLGVAVFLAHLFKDFMAVGVSGVSFDFTAQQNQYRSHIL